MATYQYEPLTSTTSIRLLTILSSPSNPLKCQLIESPLSTATFHALSYTWGAKHGTIPVTFTSGPDQDATLLLTPSLLNFLRQFIEGHADPSTRPLLWVDAVCINQADDAEKSGQIAMMTAIYHQASSTTVWLGEATPQTDLGMDMILRLNAAEDGLRMGDCGSGLANKRIPDHMFKKMKIDLPVYGEEWQCYYSLFEQPWFGRVWVIQEVVMSGNLNIKCGHRVVSWMDFSRAFKFQNEKLEVIVSDAGRLAVLISRAFAIIDTKDLEVESTSRELLDLLLRFRQYEATDPRDRVFALCGLATDAGPDRLNFRPDYSLDVYQTYTNFATAVIQSKKNLDILSVPRKLHQKRDLNLPSWVPDWTSYDSTRSLLNSTSSDIIKPLNQKASCPTQTHARFSKDNRKLELQGYILDEISSTSAILIGLDESGLENNLDIMHGETQTHLEWEHFAQARSGSKYEPTGEDMLDAYLHTITAGWVFNDNSTSKPIRAEYLKWDSYHRPGSRLRKFLGAKSATSSKYAWATIGMSVWNQVSRAPPESVFDEAINIAMNRRLVRTKRGYLGLVGWDVEVGDAIALVEGGKMPLVVRRREKGWEFVCDGYVHGVMGGECFRAERCEAMWLV